MAKKTKKAATAKQVAPATEEPKKLTADQKEFAKAVEENDRLHEELADSVPAGVDAVNPPNISAENIEAIKKDDKLNQYREKTYKYNVNEQKAPAIRQDEFRKNVADFKKKFGVNPTTIHATTATLDKLNMRQHAADAQLNVIEQGEKDGEVKLTFGK